MADSFLRQVYSYDQLNFLVGVVEAADPRACEADAIRST
jgi:hypothetical protein